MNNTPGGSIRRRLRRLSLAAGALGATFLLPVTHALAATFDLSTATIEDIQSAMNSGSGGGGNSEASNALASYTGLPTIIVPGGFFASDGMPFGVQFLGKSFTEPTLIKIASGYEVVSRHRKAPGATPPLPGEKFNYTLNVPKGGIQ